MMTSTRDASSAICAPTLKFSPPERELLDFTVSVVSSDADLRRVQRLRHIAYGHHFPEYADSFGRPDIFDHRCDVLIIAAEDKATGELVGSCRIQNNARAPLQIESEIEVPAALQGRLLAEITRLVVQPGYRDSRVRMALVKACHLHNIGLQVCGVIAGSRRSLVRMYKGIGFEDLGGEELIVNLSYAGNMPHRVLWRNSITAEADGRAIHHPAHKFLFETWHPDIRLFQSMDKLFLDSSTTAQVERDI